VQLETKGDTGCPQGTDGTDGNDGGYKGDQRIQGIPGNTGCKLGDTGATGAEMVLMCPRNPKGVTGANWCNVETKAIKVNRCSQVLMEQMEMIGALVLQVNQGKYRVFRESKGRNRATKVKKGE